MRSTLAPMEPRDLFAVPPKEFTAARDALAKELKARGKADEAQRVAKLRRPTAALWAVNQLGRTAPDEVRALLDASEDLRRQQARAVRGGGGDELRAAMGAQRAALAGLEQRAAAALREAGLPPAQSTLRAVQSTLQAAATGDRETREQLREGMLEHELAPKGFEALLGAATLSAVPSPREPSRPAAAGKPREQHPPRGARAPDAAAARRAAARARREEERELERERRRAAQEERQRAQEEKSRAREVAAAEAVLRRLEERAQAADRAAHAAREEAKAARARLEQLRK